MEEKKIIQRPGDNFHVKYQLLNKPLTVVLAYAIARLKLRFSLTLDIDPKIKEIEGPVLALGNHISYQDFWIMQYVMWPKRMHFVMSNTFKTNWWSGFVFNTLEQIPKSQFYAETSSIAMMKRVAKKGCSIALYPEGRMSLTGRTGYISIATAKLIKSMDLPVVMVLEQGFGVCMPLWSKKTFRGKTKVTATILLSIDEVRSLSADEIYIKVLKAFEYNDFTWSENENIYLNSDFCDSNIKGLEKILYPIEDTLENFKNIPNLYDNEVNNLADYLDNEETFIKDKCFIKKIDKNTFKISDMGSGFLYIDKDKFSIQLDSEDEPIEEFPKGKLHTITGNIGESVDIPAKDAIYRAFFDPVKEQYKACFWMKAVEAQYKLFEKNC